ncbi:hypothetical protein BDR04DRAFT_1213126 [Suillus decipiens]|nr:hypothetical protein BDR04DRAFT_1213126 [Suillus decipiens]
MKSTPALTAPAAAPMPVIASPSAGPAASIEDATIKVNNILMSIIAQKLKRPSKISSAAKRPLEELGSALSIGHSGVLGKYTSDLVSHLISGKMPSGFNSPVIKTHLVKTWGLGPSRTDGVLLLRTTTEPAKHLSSEAEGKAWLDTVVTIYAQHSGISLSSGGAGGASSSSRGGAIINSEEFLKFHAEQEQFATQHSELYRACSVVEGDACSQGQW